VRWARAAARFGGLGCVAAVYGNGFLSTENKILQIKQAFCVVSRIFFHVSDKVSRVTSVTINTRVGYYISASYSTRAGPCTLVMGSPLMSTIFSFLMPRLLLLFLVTLWFAPSSSFLHYSAPSNLDHCLSTTRGCDRAHTTPPPLDLIYHHR
jgi:hypothetical protein